MRLVAALGLTAGAAAVVAVAYGALTGTPQVAHFDIEAEPRVIDEGDLVEFQVSNERFLDPATGEELAWEEVPPIPDLEWDFDDGNIAFCFRSTFIVCTRC